MHGHRRSQEVLTPKSKEQKQKISKQGYIKLKGLCPAKETINEMKWVKIIACHISDKGLISKKNMGTSLVAQMVKNLPATQETQI